MTTADEPIRFYFSVAPLQSAMMRAADGGARLKIDIPEMCIDEINRLFDIAIKQGGVTFAAVVLPLDGNEVSDEGVEESLSHGGPKINKRAARRPTDVA